MDQRYLRYFIVVAEELSFTRAADRLHTVQPSLSQQIRKLEDIVGTPLFHRDTRHVQLTEAGRVFLPEARNLLQSTNYAIALARQAARTRDGQLTIGLLPGAESRVFGNVLPVLCGRCPEIQLSLRSLPSPEQLAALQNHQIDVGFLRGPIEDPEIAWEVVMREPVVAAVPAEHALAKLERIPIPMLAQAPLVAVTRACAPVLHDITNQVAKQAGVRFNPAVETDNVVATLHAVGSNMGFSLIPDYARQIVPRTVVIRPLDLDPPPEIELLVAFRKDNNLQLVPLLLALLHEFILEST